MEIPSLPVMKFLFLPLLGLSTTIILLAMSCKIFPKLNLLDFPQRYGLSRPRLPYPTGIIPLIVASIFIGIILPSNLQTLGLLLGILLLGCTSFIDDRTPLPAWLRLFLHTLSALIIFVSGTHIFTITNPLGGILKLDSIDFLLPGIGPLPLLSAFFTIGWILLTINALNWSDGIPGNTSAISSIGFLLIGLLALLRNQQPDIAMIAFILGACALACVFFELPYRRVLLGDTGAMFFGLMLGVLGILQGGKVATVFLALGVPIVDALLVTIERIIHRHSPLKGRHDHLHDLLCSRGWHPTMIVLFSVTIGGIFGSLALFATTLEKAILGVILIVFLQYVRSRMRMKKSL